MSKEYLLDLKKKLAENCSVCRGRGPTFCVCQKKFRFYVTLFYSGVPRSLWRLPPKKYLGQKLLELCKSIVSFEFSKSLNILLARDGELLEKSAISVLKFFLSKKWAVHFIEFGDLRSNYLKPKVLGEGAEESEEKFRGPLEKRVLLIHDFPIGFEEKPVIRMELIKLLKQRRKEGLFTFLTCKGSRKQFARDFVYIIDAGGEEVKWLEL